MKIKRILFAVAMVMAAVTASAQKGMQGVGINAEVNSTWFGFDWYGEDYEAENICYGGNIKYQYNIYDRGRIEPYISFTNSASLYKYEDADMDYLRNFKAGISYHQFLNGIRRHRVYLIASVGYMCIALKSEKPDYSKSREGIVYQAGFGYEYKLSYNWSLQTEALVGSNTVKGSKEIGISFKIGVTRNF